MTDAISDLPPEFYEVVLGFYELQPRGFGVSHIKQIAKRVERLAEAGLTAEQLDDYQAAKLGEWARGLSLNSPGWLRSEAD